MSIIQTIRERGGLISAIIIAIALLGFILTDYFQAKDRLGSSGSTTLGSVNGKKIDWADFETRLKAIDADATARARQQGRELSEADRQGNNDMLWNDQVEKMLMEPEFKKVGIEVGKKEFNEYLFGQNPPEELRSMFSDQQGNYDGAAAQNAINQRKRSGTPAEVEQLDAFLANFEYRRKLEKFNSLLSNSVYYPKWYVEKQNAEAASLAKVSFVSYPFTKISDSTVKVSDKEIEEYVKKHKDQYTQEESRSIAYVLFDASASAADSARMKTQLEELKPEFTTTTEPARFVSGKGSVTPYADIFISKTIIQVPAKDSIFPLAKGAVYGPYLDQHSYVMAKKVDEKTLPDSVYCRHILMRTSGEGALTDSIAQARIDSAIKVIDAGANFVTVMKAVSMDAAANTQDSLGIMRFSSFQIQDATRFDQDFGKYILFDGTRGQRKKVKTNFGYHYIEIIDQKNFQPHYKVAYFSKNIIASEETERVALDKAGRFSSDSKDMKTFDENIAKSNGTLEKLDAAGIGPNDVSIQSINQKLGAGFQQIVPCRQLVRDIYKADKGDVLKEKRIGDIKNGYKYVVAIVTDVLEKGTQPAHVARPRVEPILKNDKRAEHVKKMIGTATTLEAVAGILQDSIITVDSLRMQIRNQYGFSPKAIGAIFNSANKGKLITQPFAGSNSVVVIRVDDITSTSVLTGDIESQKAQMRLNTRGMQTQFSNPVMLLRKGAKIKDNRRDFY